MAYQRIVGLQVTDEASYSRYRENMTPILAQFGGVFRYDFRLAEVLKNEGGAPINRVFVLSFPSKDHQDRFFADPDYLKVRETWLKPAVGATTVIAEFED